MCPAHLAETGAVQRADQTGIGVVVLVAFYADQVSAFLYQCCEFRRILFVALCELVDRKDGRFRFLAERFPGGILVYCAAGEQRIIFFL
jgi:hypothetical protein